MLADSEIIGHRFPGGRYTIAHWENFLLTDCTTADQLPDGLVHPVAMFHVPILGCGVSIAELFDICGAEGPGSVGLDGYDWEYFLPLTIDTEYSASGSIVHWEHCVDDRGRPFDSMRFAIELRNSTNHLVARATNTWRFRRAPSTAAFREHAKHEVTDATPIPDFVVDSVDPQRMKTMAAILRDPYRVHWDREATTAMGLGGRVINQGPLNVSYIVNALHAFAGVGCIRRLTVNFHRPVFDGDRVIAGGRLLDERTGDGSRRVHVWLERHEPEPNEVLVSGEALIDGDRASRT
jgi:acyl dehydratase